MCSGVGCASAGAPAQSRTRRTRHAFAPTPLAAAKPTRHEGCGAQAGMGAPRSRACPWYRMLKPARAPPCVPRSYARTTGTYESTPPAPAPAAVPLAPPPGELRDDSPVDGDEPLAKLPLAIRSASWCAVVFGSHAARSKAACRSHAARSRSPSYTSISAGEYSSSASSASVRFLPTATVATSAANGWPARRGAGGSAKEWRTWSS